MKSTTVPVWLRQLGWPGVLGALALMAAVWCIQFELPQQQAQLKQIESDGRRLRHQLLARAESIRAAEDAAARASERGLVDANAGSQALWRGLWQDLPDASQRLNLQRAVLASAQEAGVPLAGVQWRGEVVSWVGDAHPQGLWRQRLVMPVQAAYPALRTWLSLLLREPALSLDSLDIQRSDPMSDQVKAQVSVSLWWRQERGR